ncbi:MAG: GNAT family N-acetyltransferase [Deltaproteobacteria bacterium]|nr:GNAT family N-acetyltransferase [Deltaproteobacteria bacterium]
MDATPETLRRYTAHDRLLDGRALLIRAIRPDDKPALQDGLHRLSSESAYFRFFGPKHELSLQELIFFTEVDFARHVALVAIIEEEDPIIIGVGRYVVSEVEPIRSAEIAFAVDDAHQGLGIATILLRHLAKIARAADVSEFSASVLAGNQKMLLVLSHSGLPQKRTVESDVVNIRLSLVGPPIT